MEKKKGLNILEQLAKRSKRELVLIYILIIVVILAGGVMLLLRPAIDTHEDVSAQLSSAQQQKDEVDMMIDQTASLQEQVTQYKKDIKSLEKQFNEMMVNEDIDSLVTSMVIGSGLRPVSLQIGAADDSGQTEQNAQNGSAASGETSDSSSEQQNANTESTDNTDAAAGSTDGDSSSGSGSSLIASNNSQVTSTLVSIKVKGTMAQFSSLTDRIFNQKGVALQSFTLTSQENDSSSSALTEVLNEGKKEKSYPYTAELIVEVYQSNQV